MTLDEAHLILNTKGEEGLEEVRRVSFFFLSISALLFFLASFILSFVLSAMFVASHTYSLVTCPLHINVIQNQN
jgi:hypothetical protein